MYDKCVPTRVLE